MKLSLICPTNDRAYYESHVGAWLKLQMYRDFEEIVVDAEKKNCKSAAEAMNAGAKCASGEYLVFLHHDVCVDDSGFLSRLVGFLEANDFAVAGVAGTIVGSRPWRRVTYTNILHGAHRVAPWGSPKLDGVMNCETVDECFFVIPQSVYRQHPFPNLCGSWHLYAVEYCLWAAAHQIEPVIALPLSLWHVSSGGSLNRSYYQALWELARLYRKQQRWIYTPMGAWPTNRALLWARILLDRVRNGLKGRHDD